MNGTALRKPTARRVVGMVAGIVIIALGIALFKQSHLGNDSISALNSGWRSCSASRWAPRTCARTSCFSCWNSGSGASTSALAPSSTASASGTSSRRSMTPFTPTSATRRRWRCSWRGSSRRCWSRRWALGGLVGLGTLICAFALGPSSSSSIGRSPKGAAIQTEQLRNPAASNHTLGDLFYCCR